MIKSPVIQHRLHYIHEPDIHEPVPDLRVHDLPTHDLEEECGELAPIFPPHLLCPVEEAARIVGQKWTLQIVHSLIGKPTCRFCELQHALGGVNPSTLSSRLKMLEEEGLVQRIQISSIPPHVEYKLTEMGEHLSGVIRELTQWSRIWLCDESVAI